MSVTAIDTVTAVGAGGSDGTLFSVIMVTLVFQSIRTMISHEPKPFEIESQIICPHV